MSNEGFRGIPGVPDGWELVAIRNPKEGDWIVGADGEPFRVDHERSQVWPIIRKIECLRSTDRLRMQMSS